MLSGAELAGIADWCRRRGVRLVSDEIYQGLFYGKPAGTALAHAPDAIAINSFSKYFSMTGWRLGWMVVPPDLIRSVECLAQNFVVVSAPTLSQHAAIVAFDCTDELEANVGAMPPTGRCCWTRCRRRGFEDFASADGAFYLYADITHRTNDSQEFCRRMLAETGVATTPASISTPGVATASSASPSPAATADMAEAARRLRAWRG